MMYVMLTIIPSGVGDIINIKISDQWGARAQCECFIYTLWRHAEERSDLSRRCDVTPQHDSHDNLSMLGSRCDITTDGTTSHGSFLFPIQIKWTGMFSNWKAFEVIYIFLLKKYIFPNWSLSLTGGNCVYICYPVSVLCIPGPLLHLLPWRIFSHLTNTYRELVLMHNATNSRYLF